MFDFFLLVPIYLLSTSQEQALESAAAKTIKYNSVMEGMRPWPGIFYFLTTPEPRNIDKHV